jgi:hypothetical protein
MGHVSRKDWVAGREGRTKTLEDLSDPCCRHSRSTSRMLSKSLTLPRVCYKKPQGPGTTVRRRQGDRQTCALDAYRPSRRHHVGSFCDPDIRTFYLHSPTHRAFNTIQMVSDLDQWQELFWQETRNPTTPPAADSWTRLPSTDSTGKLSQPSQLPTTNTAPHHHFESDPYSPATYTQPHHGGSHLPPVDWGACQSWQVHPPCPLFYTTM